MSKPLVTIIIPMFNGAATVARTITSICAQSIDDWQAIVVDDGSTDSGAVVAMEAANGDARVKMVRQENRGLAGARNAGIAQADGRYLHFLDADDWLEPDALERLMSIAQANHLPAACARLSLCDEREAIVGATPEYRHSTIGFGELVEACHFPAHAQIVEREAVGALRFDESLDYVEDWDFWLRLAGRGVRWATGDTLVGTYRLRAGSMSRRSAKMFRAGSRVLSRAFIAGRAAGWASRGVDLSEERLDTLLDHLAIEAATTAALDDPTPRKDSSAAILALRSFSGSIDPFHAAARARARLPYADCQGDHEWDAHMERYAGALAALWERCVEERWAPSGFVEQARRKLASALVTPEMIAESLADACAPGREVVVLGLGRNGRKLVRLLASRGAPFSVFDDAMTESPDWARAEGLRLNMLPDLGMAPRGAVCLITPLEDSSLVARALDLPGPILLRRWRIAADSLADLMHARLIEAWPTMRPGAFAPAKVG